MKSSYRKEVQHDVTVKLSECVSQITISKETQQKEPAFTLVRECKGARVVQK